MTTQIEAMKQSKAYKIVHQNEDKIIIENIFDNYPEAIISLGNSIYMEPFIIIDDGTLDIETMTPDEAKTYAIERISFNPIVYDK